jgi:hypothetical protein
LSRPRRPSVDSFPTERTRIAADRFQLRPRTRRHRHHPQASPPTAIATERRREEAEKTAAGSYCTPPRRGWDLASRLWDPSRGSRARGGTLFRRITLVRRAGPSDHGLQPQQERVRLATGGVPVEGREPPAGGPSVDPEAYGIFSSKKSAAEVDGGMAHGAVTHGASSFTSQGRGHQRPKARMKRPGASEFKALPRRDGRGPVVGCSSRVRLAGGLPSFVY